jgi:tetratricopeptide (TPR) repeat protein
MIKFLVNKALGKKSEKEEKSEKIASKIKENVKNFSGFLSEKTDLALKEYASIKEKSKNLVETNYQLGINHLEKGNLSDASLRFFIMTKFWPQFYEAYYQLAYVLILKEKPLKAKKVLEDVISKNAELDPKFQELLNEINANIKSFEIDA